MLPFAFFAAFLFVLGVPAIAAVGWRRSRNYAADSVELVAVAYGGIGIAALALWIVSQLAGFSPASVVVASIGAALLLAVPAVMRLWQSVRVQSDETPMTGHHDGRMIPDAVVDRSGPKLRLSAPASNAHFAVLSVAGGLFALLCYLPFLNYGWVRPDGVHRMAMTDWYKHLVTTTTVAMSDAFPPANPFLGVADSAPYYYGFHLVAAAMARLGSVLLGPEAAGQLVYPALLLLTLLTALATPFVVYTAARTMASGKGDSIGDTAIVPLFAALGGTFLAGFDLIPLGIDAAINLARGAVTSGGFAALREAIPSTHLDYWIHHNERQFNAPYLTNIWAPQHMAAVLVALLVLHLVIRRRLVVERAPTKERMGAGWLLPGLLLASLAAISAYVAMGLAVGVAGAICLDALSRRCSPWHTPAWQMWLSPGVAAAILALPVGAVLASSSGGGFAAHVSDAGSWVNGAVFSTILGSGWISRTLDSFAVYLVEFGILGVLAFLEVRRLRLRRRLSAHQAHLVWMIVTILVFVVFVRPPVGGPNNLYARPLVLVWFLLTPFAAMRVARLSGVATRTGGLAGTDHEATSRAHRRSGAGDRRWVAAGVLLCLMANGYALAGVMLEGALFWATPRATIEATDWVNTGTPSRAVVAVAPEEFVSSFGYFMRRRLALGDERHALLFGAREEQFADIAERLQRARSGASASGAADAMAAAGADVMLLDRGNGVPAWVSSPCFETAFEGEGWLAVVRTNAPCETGGTSEPR